MREYCAAAGLEPVPIGLTRAQRRWGSCSDKSRIRINWRLVQAPDHRPPLGGRARGRASGAFRSQPGVPHPARAHLRGRDWRGRPLAEGTRARPLRRFRLSRRILRPEGFAYRPCAAHNGIMRIPTRFNPTSGVADFWSHIRRPQPYRWTFVTLSILPVALALYWGMGSTVYGEPERPKVTYITTLETARTDAEIVAENRANQEVKDLRAAAQDRIAARKREIYKRSGRSGGHGCRGNRAQGRCRTRRKGSRAGEASGRDPATHRPSQRRRCRKHRPIAASLLPIRSRLDGCGRAAGLRARPLARPNPGVAA